MFKKTARATRITFTATAIFSIMFDGIPHGWAQADTAILGRPNDAQLIAAAKADGGLTFYGSSSVVALQSDADGFKAAYGIPVTFLQITSAPLSARVEQEIAAGAIQPDVIISADLDAMDKWARAGELSPLPKVDFPKRTEYTAFVQAVYEAIFFNPAMVPEADRPKTWNDILLPRFKGKIVLGSPRIAPGFCLLYYALLKDPNYGRRFFEKLATQDVRVVQTPVLIAQSVASGEAALGFVGLPYEVTNVKRQNPNAPIEYRYLDVVTLSPSAIGINSKSKKPNAAKLFAMWMMSPEGQVAHNGDGRASSVLGSLPGTLTPPGAAKGLDITTTQVTAEYRELIAMFDELFR